MIAAIIDIGIGAFVLTTLLDDPERGWWWRFTGAVLVVGAAAGAGASIAKYF